MRHAANPTDNVRIAYELEGSGPPLVLFHGSATSSRLWRLLGYADALARRHQLILLDARGHGASDKPHDEDAYGMQRLVGDIIAVLDAEGIERAHFFGYSMGGRVGFAAGRYAPERFASFIIGGGSYLPVTGVLDQATFPGATALIASSGMAAFIDRIEELRGAPLPAPLREMYLANDVEAIIPYLRRCDHEESMEPALERMTMPILLFAGERDSERLAQSRAAAERLPNATLSIIPGETHVSTALRADLVLPLISDFLARTTRKGAAIA